VLERIGARRALLISALGVAVLVGTVAAANLQSQAIYYLTPSEVTPETVTAGQTVRLGGLVQQSTLRTGRDGEFEFVITDGNRSIRVVGRGAIPGLLREGAGAIVEGSFGADATFLATQVIAKHDEVYTAPKAGATPPHRTAP
jgi:cytochrome c-type biogenesis protein CcmE